MSAEGAEVVVGEDGAFVEDGPVAGDLDADDGHVAFGASADEGEGIELARVVDGGEDGEAGRGGSVGLGVHLHAGPQGGIGDSPFGVDSVEFEGVFPVDQGELDGEGAEAVVGGGRAGGVGAGTGEDGGDGGVGPCGAGHPDGAGVRGQPGAIDAVVDLHGGGVGRRPGRGCGRSGAVAARGAGRIGFGRGRRGSFGSVEGDVVATGGADPDRHDEA
ncbi:MAG: hypothetical protein EA398_11245 [Deltaproteobacteria bacterium]|nr:MAG: hypothetical protein EA398_11245 [Deltaproteobacteria bacterium]